jgi:hypothetical protein
MSIQHFRVKKIRELTGCFGNEGVEKIGLFFGGKENYLWLSWEESLASALPGSEL